VSDASRTGEADRRDRLPDGVRLDEPNGAPADVVEEPVTEEVESQMLLGGRRLLV
jgi:hypothetical protein